MVLTRSKTKKHKENPDDGNKHTKMNLNVEVVQKDGSNLPRKRVQLEVDQFNQENKYKKRGIAMIPFRKGCGYAAFGQV